MATSPLGSIGEVSIRQGTSLCTQVDMAFTWARLIVFSLIRDTGPNGGSAEQDPEQARQP